MVHQFGAPPAAASRGSCALVQLRSAAQYSLHLPHVHGRACLLAYGVDRSTYSLDSACNCTDSVFTVCSTRRLLRRQLQCVTSGHEARHELYTLHDAWQLCVTCGRPHSGLCMLRALLGLWLPAALAKGC